MALFQKIGLLILGGWATGFALFIIMNQPGAVLKPEILTPLIVFAFILVVLVKVLAIVDEVVSRR